MEIPYTVEPRKDTGLYNAKVGIWLFLASEVMLFGALFSSYILLRVGSDPGHWPELQSAWPAGLLNIPIGTFNTAVLIASSLTVLLAWASLKLGNFARFRVYMAITLACAFGFLGIKSYEYYEKFTHYEVRLKDGTAMIGHIEGNPAFWSLKTLEQKKLDGIKFMSDAAHKAAGHGEAKFETIPKDKIESLWAFIPRTHPFFAIYFTLTALHGLHVLGGALVMAWIAGPGGKMWKTQPEQYANRIEVAGLFWHFVDLVWIFLFPVIYLL